MFKEITWFKYITWYLIMGIALWKDDYGAFCVVWALFLLWAEWKDVE